MTLLVVIDPVGEARMDIDQIFAELQRAANDSERQMLVSNALRSGVEIGHIREMLDYLEFCASECCSTHEVLKQEISKPEIPKPKSAQDNNHRKWNWASYFSH